MAGKLYRPEDFWIHVGKAIQEAAYESMGQRLFVDSISSGMIRLVDAGGNATGVAPYVGIEQLAVGQEVWVEPVAAKFADGRTSKLLSWIVVGPVRRSDPTVKNIDGTILKLLGAMDLILTSDAGGASTVFSVDGATGNVVAGDVTGDDAIFATTNTPFVLMQSQSASDTSSTTSTSTYSDACALNVALPAGTWNVKAMSFCGLKHSAGNNANIAAEVDGTLATARTLTCPSADYRMCIDDANLGSLSGGGTKVVKTRFKSSDAGTTSANNPGLIVIATRTA